MNINQKAKEFASYVKSTDEFKYMNKCKADLEKNRSLKKQLDIYISKKNNICSRNSIDEAPIKLSQLNKSYVEFFNNTVVAEYMNATKDFNSMMESLYKTIEHELLK